MKRECTIWRQFSLLLIEAANSCQELLKCDAKRLVQKDICRGQFRMYTVVLLFSEWMTAGPVGAVYDATPSGWFNSRTFAGWFEEVFLPATMGPHVIIGDNLASHFEPAVFWRYARSMASTSCHSCQT